MLADMDFRMKNSIVHACDITKLHLLAQNTLDLGRVGHFGQNSKFPTPIALLILSIFLSPSN